MESHLISMQIGKWSKRYCYPRKNILLLKKLILYYQTFCQRGLGHKSSATAFIMSHKIMLMHVKSDVFTDSVVIIIVILFGCGNDM